MAKMRTKEETGMALHRAVPRVDIAELEDYHSRGLLDRGRHPRTDLSSWCYSSLAVNSRQWDRVTLMCRGLVTDGVGNVVARPFGKFFDYEEHMGPLPTGPYEVWEKVDGSLGVMYWMDDEPYVATRRSFRTKQSAVANRLLRSQYAGLWPSIDRDVTYVFEIVYPENPSVVRYDEERLVLLGTVDKATGQEFPPRDDQWPHLPEFFGIAGSDENPLHLKLLQEPNREGFVIRYTGSGLKLKVKFDDYLIANKHVFDTNAATIWRAMRGGVDGYADSIRHEAPAWFVDWVETTEATIRGWYDERLAAAAVDLRDILARRPGGDDRRWIAEQAKATKHPGLVMLLLDGKSTEKVWQDCRPAPVQYGEPIVRLDEWDGMHYHGLEDGQ